MPFITAQKVRKLLDAGEAVTIVDSRRREAYDAGHIAGALSLPWREVQQRQNELPREGKIVFYFT